MTVGSSFIIDPDGIVRTADACPIARGCNSEEILRTVRTPATSGARSALAPETRYPGDRVIETAPAISYEGAWDRECSHQTIEPEFDK